VHGLLNSVTQERSFPINIFDKLVVNMTSCSELEEAIDEERANKENCSGEMDKTVAALEAMPICMN